MRITKATAVVLVSAALSGAGALIAQKDESVTTGIREASWSPDGKRIAATWFDAIWTMTADGRDPKRLVPKSDTALSERDPDWLPDGKSIAFSGQSNSGFDLWIAPASGGAARRITSMPGDERWPSWTRDGRIVFSQRALKGEWHLYTVNADGTGEPNRLSPDGAAEWQARVSPDGARLAFVSDREPDANNDVDVWVRALPAKNASPTEKTTTVRVTRTAGDESHPVWASDNSRIAYAATRAGSLSVWVSNVPAADSTPPAAGQGGRGGRGFGGGAPGAAAPESTTVLASRHGGVPAWSPDGQTLLIA